MTNQWGGPRPNAGKKPGQKNKTPAQGRVKNIIKQVTFTPSEWDTIKAEIPPGHFNKWARSKLINPSKKDLTIYNYE